MNCTQAIEYIHSLEKFGMKPGLERISALCELLGNPQNSVKFVHVAGTNGKGSTSTMISNILRKAGYNVGLFTSPYVIDFRERIQLNGRMIDPYELAQTVSKVKNAVDILEKSGIQPTEFEVITAAAFVYFAAHNCDVAVLEVGLGGRYDSTNVIVSPLVSVITSISMDHMGVLGNTVEKIAAEKCGIIKFGGTCVSYPEQVAGAAQVIKSTCEELKNRLIIPDLAQLKLVSSNAFGSVINYKGNTVSVPLTGEHMVKNAVTAIEAACALDKSGFRVTAEHIAKGIEASSMPARLEVLRSKPFIILDGGHNEDCARALAQYIRANFAGKRVVAVCSMMADKDYPAYLEECKGLFDTFIASKTNVMRSLSAESLCDAAKPYFKNCYSVADVDHALAFARSITEENDVLIVCGSFYFAGEVRDKIMNF